MIVLEMPIHSYPAYAQQSKPNFVVVLVDDLDEDSFTTMLIAGKLPNIHQLINRGARFSNSFVVQSMCCPSRASFLSGKYSHNTGVFSVVGRESGMGAFDATAQGWSQNLAVWLNNNNYYTGYIGKTMNHNASWVPYTTWNGYDFWRNIRGYDGRPRQYLVNVDGNSTPVTPDKYQTKYVADEATAMINNFAARPEEAFFTVVAPQSPHINLPSWQIAAPNFNQTVIVAGQTTPYDDSPIVTFNAFTHQGGYIVQQVIKGNSASGYGVFARGTSNGLGDWSYLGSIATVFPNTGSLPIISFNAFVRQPENLIRQHLLRGSQSQGYQLYYRDQKVDGGYDGFILYQPPNNEDLFPNTGSLPIIEFSITNLNDSSTLQELIRGNEASGYYRFSRMVYPTTNWFSEDLNWDHGSGFGAIVAYNNLYLGNNRIRHQLVRYNTSNNQDVYYQDLPSVYNPNGSVQGISTEDSFTATMHLTEAEQMLTNLPASPTTITPPHLYYSGRLFADGAWANHQAYQSFNYGGTYPAGSLRVGNNPHGYTPLLPQFDLPTHKASFNYVDCANQPSILCTSWPDLNQMAFAGRTQKQYLTRFHLDRLETLISLDALIGQIVSTLNNQGLYNDTFIIFTSDNGHFVGEHRLSNKIIHYEESARVPLIIKPAQGTTATAFTNQNTVANIDLAPTILDYAGLNWQSSSYNVDGRSLKTILTNRVTLYTPWRRLILYEGKYPRNTDPSSDPSDPMSFASNWDWAWAIPDHYGMRIGLEASTIEKPNQSITLYYGDPYNIMNPETSASPRFVELYNLVSDPYQVNNLYHNPSNTVNPTYQAHYPIYRDRITALRSCSGATCRELDSAPLAIASPTYNQIIQSFNKSSTSIVDINLDGRVNLFDLNAWLNFQN